MALGIYRNHLGVQVAPMLFPMYTVPAERLLEMSKIEPHEKLKAGGGNPYATRVVLRACRTKCRCLVQGKFEVAVPGYFSLKGVTFKFLRMLRGQTLRYISR